MAWSPQQEAALKAVSKWLKTKAGPQVFRVFGYAGTGKTTLAQEIAKGARGKVLYGAFTGKAALVLQSKGCADASTIHSLIYSCDEAEGGLPTFTLNPASAVADAGLVIIDECSMVDEALGRDLLSFGVKVLVLGDPAQLPPVKGAGFFTSATPDVMLTEVHRQARDNPIIRLSMTVREGGKLERGTYDRSTVIGWRDVTPEQVVGADQVLVGLNRTRRAYNGRIRQLKDIDDPLPVRSDRLVCLRNSKSKGLLNGGIWTVKDILPNDKPSAIQMHVAPEDAGKTSKYADVLVHHAFFRGEENDLPWDVRKEFEEFDFGYALTVHKSQGSQWNDVVLFDESAAFREDRARHLYTGITRAAERVTVVQR